MTLLLPEWPQLCKSWHCGGPTKAPTWTPRCWSDVMFEREAPWFRKLFFLFAMIETLSLINQLKKYQFKLVFGNLVNLHSYAATLARIALTKLLSKNIPVEMVPFTCITIIICCCNNQAYSCPRYCRFSASWTPNHGSPSNIAAVWYPDVLGEPSIGLPYFLLLVLD